MKTIICILLAALGVGLAAPAHNPQEPQKVTRANYEQAARFTTKKIGQMVHSTRIRPNWFEKSDRFWYSWKTSEGTRYYIVDPATGSKKEIFDMDRLARQITEITRDPYDARHLPLRLELKDDKTFQWDMKSKQEKRDSAGNTTGKFVEYRFYYDIASGKLTYDTEEHKDDYPSWANVSPDGAYGIYVKTGKTSGKPPRTKKTAPWWNARSPGTAPRTSPTPERTTPATPKRTAPPATSPCSVGPPTASTLPYCAGT